MYHADVAQFEVAWLDMMLASGMLTDELQYQNPNGFQLRLSFADVPLDARILPEGTASNLTDVAYSDLQLVRTYGVQANGALASYAPAAPGALRGEVYALQGYAEVLLADLFCSGVPLSTLEFEGEYQYRAGSTTTQVYQHALTLFDSALTLAPDSIRIATLARVGKARTFLDLGQLDSAARVADAVADTSHYQFPANFLEGQNSGSTLVSVRSRLAAYATVSDREGITGLPYLSSGDPRTATRPFQGGTEKGFFPVKYNEPGSTALVVVASGVEARLIQAEVALHDGDITAWLTTLNMLRTDGTFTTAPDSIDATKTDTIWNAGTGGVAGLKPLVDPGTPTARVDLLFAERAAWLFLTGTRQGDLRRLIRQYGRRQNQVYPTGNYPSSTILYGSDVTAPIPVAERQNPLFTGCLSRGA
jgi:hypothetical protein